MRLGRVGIFLIALMLVSIFFCAPALAILSQGYTVTTAIPAGSLVSVDSKSSNSVVVADLTNEGRLFGVVVPTSATSSESGGGQVQVATSGVVNVLVSTAGGVIHTGDLIAISPVAGVGQKVGSKSIRAVGTAQSDFDGTGSGVTKRTINSGSGHKDIAIGQIPVVMGVTPLTTNGTQQFVPGWLQSFSNSLAGKPVSSIRIVVAGIILIAALISISVLLYAAVRNSIISIGRNPLATNAVQRSLIQVVLTAVAMFAVTAVVIYLVITR